MAMRGNEARRQKRLVEYVCLVGVDQLVLEEDGEADEDCPERTQHPQLLRRFPAQDHPDCNIFVFPSCSSEILIEQYYVLVESILEFRSGLYCGTVFL